MTLVTRRENESIESLIKRFKKSVDDEGILTEVKARKNYKKPSIIKAEKKKEKIRVLARMRRKEREIANKLDK